MKILNFGSLNIDRVYNVEHFVQPGETISAEQYEIFCGGKGLNQSIALARAGACVFHAGMVGDDGDMLLDVLQNAGVNTDCIEKISGSSGHAVIEVDKNGQNRIIVFEGSNGSINEAYADKVLRGFGEGDILLLQNEVANVSYIMKQAYEKGMKIALNPSPVNERLLSYPMELVHYFMLNEVEGRILAGTQGTDVEDILSGLSNHYPDASIVLTLGERGAYFKKNDHVAFHPICKVDAIDTTAAGDTFCGYFMSCLSKGFSPEEALHTASLASAIVVGRKGASPSIPDWEEVEAFKKIAVIN